MTRAKVQYTIRAIPRSIDRLLRQRARLEKRSLNQVTLEALQHGLGSVNEADDFHDLDECIGSWQEDPAFEEAMKAQDQIDSKLWR